MLQFLQIPIAIRKGHQKNFDMAMGAASYIPRCCKDAVGLQGVVVSIGRVCHTSPVKPIWIFSQGLARHGENTPESRQNPSLSLEHLSKKKKLWSQRKPEEGKGFQEEKLIKFTDFISWLQTVTL